MLDLLKRTYTEWSEDRCLRLGAALAYYTVFSLAPLLVLVIAGLGFFFGEQAAEGRILEQLEGMLGADGAAGVQEMIRNANQPTQGLVATVVGLVTMVIGASTVFGELQDAMNQVWDAKPSPSQGWFDYVKARLTSFSMILVVGFLMLVSLVLSAAVTALDAFLADLFPGADLLARVVNLVVGFGVVTFLFALIFKYLPDAEIEWRDVWAGAAGTAVLFAVGKELIGLYLGQTSATSVYGAAGSLVVVLLWVYYSSQILFFGAEFTQVWSRTRGSLAAGSEKPA
ncbi:MAG: YihY/virulence factor BrkB family protein [Myxococcales bacterium]|nr:YihY/virulence factor BrkB family protein [Myxococcales bacterium]